MAEIREDGWIIVSAEKDGAKLVSRPFKAENNTLALNAKGEIKLSLTDENGNILTGYEAEFSGDETEKVITWANGETTLPSVPFKVNLTMSKSSEIYTLIFR